MPESPFDTAKAALPKQQNESSKKGLPFFLIMLSLCTTLFLYALELTAVSTALPTIANALHSTEFIWVGSAYALSSTAFLPMSGGLAQTFGRRPTLLLCILLFCIGSAICGAATNMDMMIAGRTVQGLGGGGIQSLAYIVLADLVSLEERGVYTGIFGITFCIACFIGPVVGGSLASEGNWRWLFYLNLPICGLAAILVLLFMKLPTPPGSFSSKLRRLDWIGNFIIVASTTSCTIALTWGGIIAPWSSSRVLVPLILGLVGLGVFILYEAIFAKFPLIPFQVMSNRTSVSGYLQTFFVAIVALGSVYFIPVYYQACKIVSPIRSGVLLLGLSSLAPAFVLAGISVKRTGRYRPQMYLGWMLMLIGLGLLSTLRATDSTGRTVGFTILLGIGIGLEYSTTVFPVQAPLPVTLNASSLAFLLFIRSFATVWGVTIGSAVLQNQIKSRLSQEFVSQFPEGVSIAYSIIPTIPSLSDTLRITVQTAFADSLSVFWEVLIGIAGMGLLSSLLMRGLPLSALTDEKWNTIGERDGVSDNHEKELAAAA
ncbi:hypothetical protein HGRIS_005475 [Hohenbuehelia grisea]|uniref:Major facilitator superfamily (MFS) profile domain-containing protein n=1 Tax=Hohenbuehelia grisea TaxID=104357 RepID=A0ABR3JX41_9AGAR